MKEGPVMNIFTWIRKTDINQWFVAAAFLFPEGKIDLVC